MNLDYTKYPICDTDMWVYLYLSDFSNRIFQKYKKLIFADVVEQEILAWEEKNEKYKNIALYFKRCKQEGLVIVIQHELHIKADDRQFLEQALLDLNFKYGLKNSPKEKNKGEFVSALYADYFEIPFMKTNDKAFQGKGAGRKEFPDLEIKNWYDVVEEFSIDQDEKMRVRKLVEQEQEKMTNHYEKQKEEKKKADLLARLAQQMNDRRL
ncbi:hypothetical protein ACVNRM_07575 [Bacillus paranthracis]|jgi:hypothetical protein|uniref:Uncharacterized protein n=1 Tax=Bacillus cereus (strain AH820) TaxID=405535 RepID=B7JQZ4_BACC0|nr:MULTISPECIES: hypothetical protein [Bacillus]MRA59262.1 hypothetical protein [Bacillus thuringiensis]OUB98029.1 hypothetical protein BK752_12845 [Bacillus thuringiensis serovar canadensis]ACK89596.1 hypothetical protein BCAH820_4602 [Bacillus cereus AH820]KAB7640150.1 hypothetical protein GBN96_07435 [Bacillus sp. B4-WWTP-NA-D-NA-NA]KFL84387.1 hypothetical protein DJ51_3034 [Bacillus cereus]